RCENRLWEQCFLLLPFCLAKDQFSAIHHQTSPLPAPTPQLLMGMLEKRARLGLEDMCLHLLVQVLVERGKDEVEGRGLSALTR
ncbi:unnamed protein product, partial [Bubo scandiacus]